MIALNAGDYRLGIEPERGGSIARFDWRDRPLLRPTCGPSILDVASFPLSPFSNRIAQGRFSFQGRPVQLAPNLPGTAHPHPLHGFAWLAPWQVIAQGPDHAVIACDYLGGEWPWPHRTEQHFTLTPAGLDLRLTVENRAAQPMPAGLGFHPYLPRTATTRLVALHRGEWQTTPDCLPQRLVEQAQPQDWWQGQPVGTREVDTVYTDRQGDLRVEQPDLGLALTISPSENLRHTVIYTPAGADFFCVEPVTHSTDAVNMADCSDELATLAPGESLSATIRLRAEAIGPGSTRN